jgi:hypothetical protein
MVVTLLATYVVAGCGASNSAPPESQPSSNTWLSPANIERAIAFRQSFGLRADDAWVRQVAADPSAHAAISRFSVPLAPFEATELGVRIASTEGLAEFVEAYGLGFPEEFVSVRVEPDRGRVVAQFSANTSAHETALRELVGPDAPLDVEEVRWTKAELDALFDRVVHDGWLEANGFDLLDAGLNPRTNQVDLHVSSADPQAVAKIQARYDPSGEMLNVISDGTGVTMLPRGTLRVFAIDQHGRPAGGLEFELVPDIPGAGYDGNVRETGADGGFELDEITATGYEVRLYRRYDAAGNYLEFVDRILVGSARAVVGPDAVMSIVIEVELNE